MITLKSLGVLCNISKQCYVVVTTVCFRLEHVPRVIAARFDRAWSFPEFGANDNSTIEVSLGVSGVSESSGGAGASSS